MYRYLVIESTKNDNYRCHHCKSPRRAILRSHRLNRAETAVKLNSEVVAMKRKQLKAEDNPVKRAVAAVGGPTKAARVCEVSNSAIHKWINQGSITLLRHALAL